MIATTRCKGGREQVREYLIEAREKAGLTQQDVANHWNLAAVLSDGRNRRASEADGLVPCGRAVGGSEYSDC